MGYELVDGLEVAIFDNGLSSAQSLVEELGDFLNQLFALVVCD